MFVTPFHATDRSPRGRFMITRRLLAALLGLAALVTAGRTDAADRPAEIRVMELQHPLRDGPRRRESLEQAEGFSRRDDSRLRSRPARHAGDARFPTGLPRAAPGGLRGLGRGTKRRQSQRRIRGPVLQTRSLRADRRRQFLVEPDSRKGRQPRLGRCRDADRELGQTPRSPRPAPGTEFVYFHTYFDHRGRTCSGGCESAGLLRGNCAELGGRRPAHRHGRLQRCGWERAISRPSSTRRAIRTRSCSTRSARYIRSRGRRKARFPVSTRSGLRARGSTGSAARRIGKSCGPTSTARNATATRPRTISRSFAVLAAFAPERTDVIRPRWRPALC